MKEQTPEQLCEYYRGEMIRYKHNYYFYLATTIAYTVMCITAWIINP